MKKLCYQTLAEQGFQEYLLPQAPERVLQFGEGNFLRGFVDTFFDQMNERAGFNGKIVTVQPIAPGLAPVINAQEGLYTLFLRGSQNGETVNDKRVVSAISRCINPYDDYQALLDCAKNPDLRFLVSNTTEAGIAYDPACQLNDAPPASFPGKLTAFLYERFRLGGKGFIILSCELIDNNGAKLKKCVEQYITQWGLDDAFRTWVATENTFCSTLVDRIVTGYPRNEAQALCQQLGYEDNLLDTAEPFGFWVIECDQSLKEELPFEKAGLPIIVVDDHGPYKRRKVRILNGAHTALVMGAYLAGQNIVRDCMENETLLGYLNKTIYEEIMPTLDLPKEELMDFAGAVSQRFQNPFIDHSLLDICLNSTAKWTARCLPSVVEYQKRMGKLPACLVFSLAAYITFYHGGKTREGNRLYGKRGDDTYFIQDDAWILDFYYDRRDASLASVAKDVLANEQMWGAGFAQLEGFEAAVLSAIEAIETKGMAKAIEDLL